jgi:hypothetical protein
MYVSTAYCSNSNILDSVLLGFQILYTIAEHSESENVYISRDLQYLL